MKKLTTLVFAFAMTLSTAFIGGNLSSTSTSAGNPTVASAQVTVRRKRKPGFTRRVYRGGKWVGTQVWTGTKWVSRKTWQGMKWTGKKTYKTGRKVVSRTKKVVY
jgi:hypothetical protein